MLGAVLLSPMVRHNLRTFVANANQPDLQFLKEQLESGNVTPVLDKTFPLSETADAVRYLADGRVRGKVAITLE